MTRLERYKSDIAALTQEYGDLVDGRLIRVDLQQMGLICPRPNIAAKSYTGLCGFIYRTLGCTVKVTSQYKSKQTENDKD